MRRFAFQSQRFGNPERADLSLAEAAEAAEVAEAAELLWREMSRG